MEDIIGITGGTGGAGRAGIAASDSIITICAGTGAHVVPRGTSGAVIGRGTRSIGGAAVDVTIHDAGIGGECVTGCAVRANIRGGILLTLINVTTGDASVTDEIVAGSAVGAGIGVGAGSAAGH